MQEHLPLERSFSSDEVGQIMGYATRLDQLAHERLAARDDRLTYEQLRTVAEELGVDEMTLLEALHVHDVKSQRPSAPEPVATRTKRSRRLLWRSFAIHLFVYLAVIAGLSVIDVAGDERVDWVFYPAAGWGIGLAIHGGLAAMFSGMRPQRR